MSNDKRVMKFYDKLILSLLPFTESYKKARLHIRLTQRNAEDACVNGLTNLILSATQTI